MKIGDRAKAIKEAARKRFDKATGNTRVQVQRQLDQADVNIKRAQDKSKAALEKLSDVMGSGGGRKS